MSDHNLFGVSFKWGITVEQRYCPAFNDLCYSSTNRKHLDLLAGFSPRIPFFFLGFLRGWPSWVVKRGRHSSKSKVQRSNYVYVYTPRPSLSLFHRGSNSESELLLLISCWWELLGRKEDVPCMAKLVRDDLHLLSWRRVRSFLLATRTIISLTHNNCSRKK